MQVEVRNTPEHRVAYLRGFGEYPKTLPVTWPRFVSLAKSLGLLGKGLAMSIMHDDIGNVAKDQLRSDAAIEVPPEWQPQGGLEVETVPAGLFAVTRHLGAYGELIQTWKALYSQWLPTSTYRQRRDCCYEIYINEPSDTPEKDLITEIHVPVELK